MEEQPENININFRSIKFHLQNVVYQRLATKNEQLEVRVIDNVIPTNINANGFDLIFERKLEFAPVALFNIKVEYIISCWFDEAAIKVFNGNETKLEDFIEKSRVGIVNALPVVPQSALIIAELSNLANQKPLIIPPVLKDPYKK